MTGKSDYERTVENSCFNNGIITDIFIDCFEEENKTYIVNEQGYEEEYYFIVWDSEISKKMIEKVAWSFESGE